MKLTRQQRRVIQSKPYLYNIIKGEEATGKTTAALYKMLYLKNQYCLYPEDKILIIVDKKDLNWVKESYEKEKNKANLEYMSLFSMIQQNVHITTMEAIFEYYAEKCINIKQQKVLYGNEDKFIILKQAIDELKISYAKNKILNYDYLEFFLSEIKWMKSFGYLSLEKYQQAERVGRYNKNIKSPYRIAKNTINRQVIFQLFSRYNDILRKQNLVEIEDVFIMASKLDEKNNYGKYSHIIIDEAQSITKVQFELLSTLLNAKDYATMTLCLNHKNNIEYGCLTRNSKINTKIFTIKPKVNCLKDSFQETKEDTMDKYLNNSMENFLYKDIRHGRSYEILKDYSSTDYIIVKDDLGEQEYKNDELRAVPVYSDIAAGEPILINDEIEGDFYLPQYWLKGTKDCFMLKVKGDSMIGADIHDSDYVIIRKQYSAQNNDIVAVDLDGSATLKRMHIEKSKAILMPENPKYHPIVLDESSSIIGIAIGILKSNKNLA